MSFQQNHACVILSFLRDFTGGGGGGQAKISWLCWGSGHMTMAPARISLVDLIWQMHCPSSKSSSLCKYCISAFHPPAVWKLKPKNSRFPLPCEWGTEARWIPSPSKTSVRRGNRPPPAAQGTPSAMYRTALLSNRKDCHRQTTSSARKSDVAITHQPGPVVADTRSTPMVTGDWLKTTSWCSSRKHVRQWGSAEPSLDRASSNGRNLKPNTPPLHRDDPHKHCPMSQLAVPETSFAQITPLSHSVAYGPLILRSCPVSGLPVGGSGAAQMQPLGRGCTI